VTLACQACGAPFESGSVDRARGLASCRFCHAVTAVPADPAAAAAPATRELVAMPRGMRILPLRGGEWVLERRWWAWPVLALCAFAVVWDGAVLFVASMFWASGGPWFFRLFPLIHVGVGVLLTYACLAFLVNTTRVAATHGSLTVRHGPLPWRGSRTLPVSSIDQLYAVARTTRDSDGDTQSTYSVRVKRKDGTTIDLLTGLFTAEQALYVEQEVERRLGIVDRPMAGEIARS
jgi:hypothetical protein